MNDGMWNVSNEWMDGSTHVHMLMR